MNIVLQWKNFQVDLDKVNAHFKSILSTNYDGLNADQENLKVIFFGSISSEDEIAVNNYWNSIQDTDFDPTPEEIAFTKINDAVVFGNKLIIEVATENVLMGITQAGKTKAVSDYCVNLQYYLRTGSLYAAIDEIDTLIAAVPPGDLDPFITVDRLNIYKSKIQAYLGS